MNTPEAIHVVRHRAWYAARRADCVALGTAITRQTSVSIPDTQGERECQTKK